MEKFYVGITDKDWMNNLVHNKENLNGFINFWTPGTQEFKVLENGDLFLFKLHSKKDKGEYGEIVGGAFFSRYCKLTFGEAWNRYGIGNGVNSEEEMKKKITSYRSKNNMKMDDEIGCIILDNPFFFPKEEWIKSPEDWSKSIVKGKRYELSTATGKELYQEVKSRLDFMNNRQRILFCNLAYMNHYDIVNFDEKPINGGKYVDKTGDAEEKFNFHKCEDGIIRGFVETNHIGGYSDNMNSPKQLRIENIDSSFKNKEWIDNVLVVLCAKSPTTNSTVIIGWYINAKVYRNRCTYNHRVFNMEVAYQNATLLRTTQRKFKVPRARDNSHNIGFGQSNVWFANKSKDADFVKQTLKYIDSQNRINTVIEINKCNEFQDEQLNKSINNSSIVISQPFEYSNNKIIKPNASYTAKGVKYYKRDRLKAQNALNHANYKCEINDKHFTFLRKSDSLPYTEAHHLIPMAYQDDFQYSLDVEENIVSLCSNCHNEIHYGINAKVLLTKLYYQRIELLKAKGLDISLEKLLEYYNL